MFKLNGDLITDLFLVRQTHAYQMRWKYQGKLPGISSTGIMYMFLYWESESALFLHQINAYSFEIIFFPPVGAEGHPL